MTKKTRTPVRSRSATGRVGEPSVPAPNQILNKDNYCEQNAQGSHANTRALQDLRLLLHHRYLLVIVSNLLLLRRGSYLLLMLDVRLIPLPPR